MVLINARDNNMIHSFIHSFTFNKQLLHALRSQWAMTVFALKESTAKHKPSSLPAALSQHLRDLTGLSLPFGQGTA